jgi:outer membrane protein assembly factor BamB
VLQNNGVLTSYKIATGDQIYQKRIGGTGGSFSASLVAADGKIYCTSEDGDVYVIKAGPDYQELSKNPMGEVLMATPAVSDGLIIFRGLKNVIAVKP